MTTYDTFGRSNQKRRTRLAVKAAAAELVKAGKTPTMSEIAELALVSKSTAYRYFPSQDALLAEVMLDELIAPDMDAVFAAASMPVPPEEKLDAVIRADHALVIQHEAAFRTALRVMLLPDAEGTSAPRRPGNRLRYIANALEPLQDQIGTERVERLVSALAMCVGMESIMVLQDICGLSPEEAESIKRWVAAALLQAALAETN